MIILLGAAEFGSKHFIGLGFTFVLIIMLFFVNEKYKMKEKNIILTVTIAFYLLEIFKVGYMLFTSGEFPMNHLPIHLCSIPLYVFPILYFSKKGSKLESYMKATAFGVVLIAGITALVMPTNIIGKSENWLPLRENLLPVISFTYHGLMIFISLFIVKAGYYNIKFRDSLKAIFSVLVLMVIALIVNVIGDFDFMLLNKGNGSPFQFLIQTSQILYTITMIGLGIFMITLTFGIATLVSKLNNRK